jgi:hypothetical protein
MPKFIRSRVITLRRHSYPDLQPIMYCPGDTARVAISTPTSFSIGAEILAYGEHRSDSAARSRLGFAWISVASCGIVTFAKMVAS